MTKSISKISLFFFIVSMGTLISGCVSSGSTNFPSIASALSPATLSPTMSAEPLQDSIINKCVEITPTDLPKLQGTLVLEHTIESNLREILFWKMESHQEHFISKEGGEYYNNEAASPAGTYFSADTFAFSSNGEYQQRPIVIFNSDGNRATTIELKQEYDEFAWLNEEQILVNTYGESNDILLISPFTHEQKTFQPFIPIHFASSEIIHEWGFYGRHKNVYDPRMTRVLYPSINENMPTVILRDLEKVADLASFPTGYGWGSSPSWSLDGEKLGIALNTVPFDVFRENDNLRFEIFVFNRNGEKLFTTNLTSISETVYITNLSWSPNGRYIAFWYSNDRNQLQSHLQLAVFDTETRTVTRYCINSGNEYIRFSPIWSPTSDYMIVAYTVPDEKVLSSLLVNISNGKARIVKSDFEPLGWLK